ncbi:hypothetical protein [Dysgonomonas sp. GY617]|uniref:hypothetical protein n=1 Tax=Dysgonomonas sp. GY617 TaxID=2780420 RepID=UPI0018835B4E|nr:hypothetical protein [Dysgonomonas sp. GY617]MBF0576822.1 hypothetical protein [Dysgonomonas sp. GY617]
MKVKLIFFLLFIGSVYSFSQNYPNIVNYNFNGTPNYGVKIRTNLPFVNSSQMPAVKIEGYNYASNKTYVSTINLSISWYIYDNEFYLPTASSFGGTAPDIWLSNENGKVVIYLDQKIYFQRFTVSAFAQGMVEKSEYFQGWNVIDAALSGTQQKQVPYKNVFAGNVGIGIEDPAYKLDVDGDVRLGSYNGSVQSNLIIKGPNNPYGKASQRDICFDFVEAGKSIIRAYRGESWDNYLQFLTTYTDAAPIVRMHISGNGDIGIGTENPTVKLDVRGTISAEEVKVQVLTGADHVFNSNYVLKPLSELEAFVKENKHLPEIPSEKQMQEEGLNMNEFQIKLLQKIEELTLYTIQQEKRLNEQQSLIEEQNERLEYLEQR